MTQSVLHESAADAHHAVCVYSAKVLRLHRTHAVSRSTAVRCRDGINTANQCYEHIHNVQLQRVGTKVEAVSSVRNRISVKT